MPQRRPRQPAKPIDEAKLRELALAYVGRFATTRAKLRAYLARKVRERGWAGAREADLAGLAETMAERGYIDDSAYALAKSQSLTGRGYGPRRVSEKLRAAGVSEDDSVDARDHAEAEAIAAALKFAARRRIGPFATGEPVDDSKRAKALAAMVRAGHPFALARAILDLPGGGDLGPDELHNRVQDMLG